MHAFPVLRVVVLAGAWLSFGVSAGAETFKLDLNHTIGNFSVLHLGLTKVNGIVPLVSGSATIGADNLPTAATATFDASKLDTRNGKRDDQLRGPDFFDTANHPTITFVAHHVEGTAASFRMSGDLTMHGVTRPVVLNGTMTGQLTEEKRRHVTYALTGSFDRRDWGMTWGQGVPGSALIAGNTVNIEVEVDAIAPV